MFNGIKIKNVSQTEADMLWSSLEDFFTNKRAEVAAAVSMACILPTQYEACVAARELIVYMGVATDDPESTDPMYKIWEILTTKNR